VHRALPHRLQRPAAPACMRSWPASSCDRMGERWQGTKGDRQGVAD
jgi:hypothetical protein